MGKTWVEAQQQRHEDLVCAIQTMVRVRYGDYPDADQIERVGLAFRDVPSFRISDLDRVKATREVLRRYSV